MIKTFFYGALATAISMTSVAAAEELIFNRENKRAVLELYTDPDLEPWQRYTYSSELCYQGDVGEAYDSLMDLYEADVILKDPETDEYVDSRLQDGKIFVTTYSSKMEDEGVDPHTEEEIEACNFQNEVAYSCVGEDLKFELTVRDEETIMVNGKDKGRLDNTYRPRNKANKSFRRMAGYFESIGDGAEGYNVELLVNTYILSGAKFGYAKYRASGPDGYYEEFLRCDRQ